MQFLSNPNAQFIINCVLAILAIVIGVIGVIVAIAVYRKQSKKEVAYAVISDSPVISIDAQLQSKAQIIYNGKTIVTIQSPPLT